MYVQIISDHNNKRMTKFASHFIWLFQKLITNEMFNITFSV